VVGVPLGVRPPQFDKPWRSTGPLIHGVQHVAR